MTNGLPVNLHLFLRLPATPPETVQTNNFRLPLRVVAGTLYDFSPLMLASLRQANGSAGSPLGDIITRYSTFGVVQSTAPHAVTLSVSYLGFQKDSADLLAATPREMLRELAAYRLTHTATGEEKPLPSLGQYITWSPELRRTAGYLVTKSRLVTITNLTLSPAMRGQEIEVFAFPTTRPDLFDFGHAVTNTLGFKSMVRVESSALRCVPLTK
jgi:hypothetical protein